MARIALAAWSVIPVAAACGGARDVRVSGLTFISTDGRVLTVSVDSCNASPSFEVVEQSDRTVVLAARAGRTAGGDCADGGVVVLDEPLGDRALVDRSSGAPIDTSSVQRFDGNNP